MKRIKVVAGIVCNAEREYLVALRPASKPLAGLWEFPGGKIEPGETPWLALVREFHEELGIYLMQGHAWLEIAHTYADCIVNLQVWQIQNFHGIPQGKEGQQIQWVNLAQLRTLPIPPANAVILDKLAESI